MSLYENEISKRRTFAIISHPDAGKTTLTEKLLLYGGAIHLAGSVKSRKTAKHAVSDWMEIEKQRGISVTSSVLQFDYDGCRINILDTPGHQDFSEDTYRTLMAADSAVMVIDASKGVEAQTIKLFKVCVMRHIPIFTFINKLDREANDPFDLMDEIERLVLRPAQSIGQSDVVRISRVFMIVTQIRLPHSLQQMQVCMRLRVMSLMLKVLRIRLVLLVIRSCLRILSCLMVHVRNLIRIR